MIPLPTPGSGSSPFDDVLEETRALMDGTSPVTMDRVRRMEAIQGVLAL